MIKKKYKSNYESEYCNGLLVVRISGEIDHHNAVGMRVEIDEEIKAFNPKKLILDLSCVDFMDSSGLGLVLGRYSMIKKRCGDMVLLNPNKSVMKIFSLAGIERLIKIENIDMETIRKSQKQV